MFQPVKSQNLRRFVHNIPLQCALRQPKGLVPKELAGRTYKVKAQERHVQPTMMTIWCTKAQSKSSGWAPALLPALTRQSQVTSFPASVSLNFHAAPYSLKALPSLNMQVQPLTSCSWRSVLSPARRFPAEQSWHIPSNL